MPHPALVLGVVGSFLWFLAVGMSGKRHLGMALLLGVFGSVEWLALLLALNEVPRMLPFADFPRLSFMDTPYWVLLGMIPASVLVVLSGIWLKRALTTSSSLLGTFGKRHPGAIEAGAPSASPGVGRTMDILFPILLSLLIFFGAQGYLYIDADGGSYYRLGMITLFETLLIGTFLYHYLVRRLFRGLWPYWWPPAPNISTNRDA
jgi:hypothetical protein